MKFSVIIPAHNEEKYLPRLLESIEVARSNYSGGADEIELIVANNQSTDRTAEVALAHGARVVNVEKRRIAAARNGGARAAGGEILCFIDADSALHPQTFDAIDRAIADAIRSGTAVVGDISNTLVTMPRLMQSPMAAIVFYELIRFNASVPGSAQALVEKACADMAARQPNEHVRASLAAHAPYSVAPELFRSIKQAVDREPGMPWSVHLAESVDEIEFLERGTGAWRGLLEEVGAWDPTWSAPRVSPVRYLDDAGLVDARLVAVHGVQMTAADLESLAARGATLVTCPRSNGHTGAGAPPLEAFYEAGVRVAVGTDSLASAPDLNVFAELATMRALAPTIPAASLLESATRQGARALGFDAEYGAIEPGKRARLLAVAVPAGTDDVEEYLVSGITADQLLDLFYVFRLTKGSHTHHLVLALIDLESEEDSKGGVEEPERMRKTDLFCQGQSILTLAMPIGCSLAPSSCRPFSDSVYR